MYVLLNQKARGLVKELFDSWFGGLALMLSYICACATGLVFVSMLSTALALCFISTCVRAFSMID